MNMPMPVVEDKGNAETQTQKLVDGWLQACRSRAKWTSRRPCRSICRNSRHRCAQRPTKKGYNHPATKSNVLVEIIDCVCL